MLLWPNLHIYTTLSALICWVAYSDPISTAASCRRPSIECAQENTFCFSVWGKNFSQGLLFGLFLKTKDSPIPAYLLLIHLGSCIKMPSAASRVLPCHLRFWVKMSLCHFPFFFFASAELTTVPHTHVTLLSNFSLQLFCFAVFFSPSVFFFGVRPAAGSPTTKEVSVPLEALVSDIYITSWISGTGVSISPAQLWGGARDYSSSALTIAQLPFKTKIQLLLPCSHAVC